MTSVGMMILRERAKSVSALMKTLSHPNRLLIVCELMGGERSVSALEEACGVHQPVLSRELARLRDENLVSARKESKAVFYQISDPQLREFINSLCLSAEGKTPSNDAGQSSFRRLVRQDTFPTIEGRVSPRVRISPDPYRKD